MAAPEKGASSSVEDGAFPHEGEKPPPTGAQLQPSTAPPIPDLNKSEPVLGEEAQNRGSHSPKDPGLAPEPMTGPSPDPDPGYDPEADSIHPVPKSTASLPTAPVPPPLPDDHVSVGEHLAAAGTHASSHISIPDAVYDRFPRHRKIVILALLSFCSFLSPVSSTSVLAATPEVAAEYGTDGTVINVVNAIYMLMMGLSPIVWGPMSEVYGRRRVSS